MLGAAIPGEALEELVRQAAGHAFFLEEVIRTYASGKDAPGLPATVLAVAQVRLESLSVDERILLRAASILGGPFQAEAITRLVARMPNEVIQQLTALVKKEFLLVREEPSGPRYTFRHAFLQEAAYLSLTDQDRRLGHEIAANWLEEVGADEPVLLAEHCLKAGLAERAAGHFIHATERALDSNDLEEALTLSRRALEIGERGSRMGEVRLLQARVLHYMGEYDECRRRCREAMEALPESDDLWVEACGQRALACLRTGELEEAELILHALAETARTRTPSIRLIANTARLAAELTHQRMLGLAEVPRAIIKGWQDRGLNATGATKCSLLDVEAATATVAGDLERYLENRISAQMTWREVGNKRRDLALNGEIGYALLQMGAIDESIHALRRCTTENSNPYTFFAAKHNLGLALAYAGLPKEGLEEEMEAYRGFQEMGSPRMEAGALAYASRIALMGQKPELSMQLAEKAVEMTKQGALSLSLLAVACLTLAEVAGNQLDKALEHARMLATARAPLEEGEEGGMLVHLACAEAFNANGLPDDSARSIRQAREELNRRLVGIRTPRYRSTFVNLPENRRVLGLASALLN